ncbi:hypothetical protein K3728_16080 [Rhodobacteraceae bacterium M385]|nr:hypothetical protein K3728_16080 [Rhodobacteraceae bacterium M385]
MEEASHHPDLQAFIESLRRLEGILQRHEKGLWSAKITRVRQVAEASDGNCVELFLAMYGGMGSFADLVLKAPAQANDALHAERRRAYHLAVALK